MQKGSTSPEILKVQDVHQPGSLNFPLALVIQLLGESLQHFEVFDKEVHEGPYFHGHYIKMEDNRQNVIILNVKVPAPSLP